MKEATGEANMTVVTIILIGVVVVKNMMSNTATQADCMNQGKCWENNACVDC